METGLSWLRLSLIAHSASVRLENLCSDEFIDPFPGLYPGLLHQSTHRQAINEAARPFLRLEMYSVPQPCEHDGGSFAQAGGDIDELRLASCANYLSSVGLVAASKATLIVVGRVARGGLKKSGEWESAHGSPLS
jgi:hypothetical protein